MANCHEERYANIKTKYYQLKDLYKANKYFFVFSINFEAQELYEYRKESYHVILTVRILSECIWSVPSCEG